MDIVNIFHFPDITFEAFGRNGIFAHGYEDVHTTESKMNKF